MLYLLVKNRSRADSMEYLYIIANFNKKVNFSQRWPALQCVDSTRDAADGFVFAEKF